MRKTYDIVFNDSESSNSKGFKLPTIISAKAWIAVHNGTNHSYFADYKGGTVSVICNQTGEIMFEAKVF